MLRLHLTGLFAIFSWVVWTASGVSAQEDGLSLPPPASGTIRIATFNVSLHRKAYGELTDGLQKGDAQAKRIAKIVQAVAPDVLLANEVDYDEGKSAECLMNDYFQAPNQQSPSRLDFKYYYAPPVNTGVPSGLDLNHNGKVIGAEDAWGYGDYPGQYGFAVFSRYPVVSEKTRTFQLFPWSRMPGALRPMNADNSPYWEDDVWKQLRLSSKNHIDLSIQIGERILHIVASHPTPPVFDGPEDRNGCRNHDEIRLVTDYIEGGVDSGYIVDDQGTHGGLDAVESFVVVGDLNADPIDGSGRQEAINRLLKSKRINGLSTPASDGAVEAARTQGRMNLTQKGNAAEDTGDFNDGNPGNLRCDFVLPSSDLEVVASGVFWPTKDQLEKIDKDLIKASDHRLVWVDVRFTK